MLKFDVVVFFSELPNFQPEIRNTDINMFTVVWISHKDADYDKEIFEINPAMKNGTNRMNHTRDDSAPAMTITNLRPGTLYTVSMYVSDKEKRSLNACSITTYTSKSLRNYSNASTLL